MNSVAEVIPSQLLEYLLNVASARPIFVLGPPGIGKTAVVQSFAHRLGYECVSLLGSQLAAEDISGVPQIRGDKSRFCPPEMIARDDAYVLFCDELNASSLEVQKAMYSVIHERRLGAFSLHKETIVIAAGNRAQDSAVVKQMSSALVNRMLFLSLRVSAREWLAWAREENLAPLVIEYIEARPDHLHAQPPKHEEPFSTPRSWHILSDAMHGFKNNLTAEIIGTLARGCLSPPHATQFTAFAKLEGNRFRIQRILRGDEDWPRDPRDRDILYFLAQSLRATLARELPHDRGSLRPATRDLLGNAKQRITELAEISVETAQLVVAAPDGDDRPLPPWFALEIVRDIPRLAKARDGQKS